MQTPAQPLIGLTTYGRNADNRFTLPAEYVDAVRRAGGVPILIPAGESRWQTLVEALDALILTGGGDIDPDHYRGRRHETNYGIDLERDTLELELGRWVMTSGLPTLGICRGAQILNVVRGGQLIEHIPDEVGESVLHRAPPREPTPHGIRLKAGSRLAGILGQEAFEAASWHHQALRGVAQGFEAVGHAPDGTIEAIEMPSHPWLLAVQWHPELTAASDPLQQKLFDALVEKARQGSLLRG
ncbi:MAG: gamma-glutamyl-gamma-aminobutyrate hydrolase family protein [Burkholderiales bacterium]